MSGESVLKLRWTQKYRSTSMARVPEKPGLYAYGKVKKVFELERKRNIVYVGETKNLRRRLSEHRPNEEKNEKLRQYLREEKDVICWYCTLEGLSKKERRDIETQMIKALNPKFCTQHNTKPASKED